MKYTIDHLFLKNAPAEVVFKELQRLATDRLWCFPEGLELELMSRNEPLVNIALGLFGQDLEVVKQLYETDCIDTKVACLSGLSIAKWPLSGAERRVDYYKQVLSELVSTWDQKLLVALFSNNSISQDVLLGLYEKREPYKDLDNDSWLSLISLTAGAKRLQKRKDSYDYEYDNLLRAIWQLYDTFDANERNARMLFPLTKDIEPVMPDGMNIVEVQEKWNIEETDYDYDLPNVRESLNRLAQVSPDNVKKKETQEDIEKKIEDMLDEFGSSDRSVINQYNQEYRMLRDTIARISSIDENGVTLDDHKVLNEKQIFWSVIAIFVLGVCFGLYDFITDSSGLSVLQLLLIATPVFYLMVFTYANGSIIKQINEAAGLKADLCIGVDQDLFRLFRTVRYLEGHNWPEEEEDYGVQCATARFDAIERLISKVKNSKHVEGGAGSIF